MTFIHGYLLAGLALVSLPVLIHLIMRQKPKQLPFPAFRFLRQKRFINQRKLRLQHLLLMLLRMLLIAALCLGLARPRVVTQTIAPSGERPVAAVLLFDTSASMEYVVAGETRLDEAKKRARELLDEMAVESEVALLDTGDDPGGDGGAEWIKPELVRSRIDALKVRPANGPLTRQLDRAFRLLRAKEEESEEPPPRFLFLFSDRTRECWDAAEAKLAEKPEGVTSIFVDVGVDKPADLAIDKVEVEPAVVAPGGRLQIRVTVRSTGADYDSKLICHLDNEPDVTRLPDERPVVLPRGQSQLVIIERTAPGRPRPDAPLETAYQVTAKLATNDALPFNNSRYATFLVREPRLMLAIADDPKDARIWNAALKAVGAFRCDVKTPDLMDKITEKELGKYKVVCVFEVARPAAALWDKLRDFVRAGGGLVLVPGGNDPKEDRDDYNKEAEKRGLLPARVESRVVVPAGKPGFAWSGFNAQHPLTAPFRDWERAANPDFADPALQPMVNAFWAVKPVDEKSSVIAAYAEDGRRPVLVERALGNGHVVQFTTPLDGKPLERNRPWHNYWSDSSFGLVLADKVCRYLAGDVAAPELNFFCGQAPQVVLPAPAPAAPFKLKGPNLTAAEMNLAPPTDIGPLLVTQAMTPGNFTVLDARDQPFAAFSVNVRPEESQLDRVPVEEIEEILGKGAVLPVGRRTTLQDALKDHWAPPVEMMPWLMLLVLGVLVLESLLANKFYRGEGVRGP